MIKKPAVFIFVISVLGLIVITSVFFTNKDLNFQDRPSSIPEPFLCNGRPCNVILIIPESLSARHMGIYGYERDTTPFIDKFFGREGIVFENAWSTAPWTFPSFAALYTSQLGSDVFLETHKDKLSDTIPTFIDVLDVNGVPKFAAHAWTLFPRERLDSFVKNFQPEERFQGNDPFLFIKTAEWIEEQTKKDNGQPFFLLLQPFSPHAPYDPPEPYRYFFNAPSEYPGPVYEEIWEAQLAMDRGENIEAKLERFRLQYDQEIRYLDSQVESFILQISEKVRQNTVFIFTSDHGQALGQHVNIANMVQRGTLYEEEIHIPFLIRASGIESKRISEPITLLDVAPTILDALGFKSPDTFKGISLLPVLRKKELQLKERIVKAENVHYESTLWKLWIETEPKVRTEPLFYPRERALRKQDWKLIQRTDGSLELYNLERDYHEQDNLISKWRNLLKNDRAEIIPLFESLGENPAL